MNKSRLSYNFCEKLQNKTWTKIKIEQLLLFLARIVVSCSENRAREGGCPGASGHWNRVLFEICEALFLKHFLERLFSQKYRNLKENGSQNGTNSGLFLVLFWRKVNMQKSCWDSSENPSERVLGGPKITKKLHLYKHIFYNPVFWGKNWKICKKKTQHGSQNVS